MLEQTTVSATPAGYRQLLRLANRQHGRRVWAIEGTGGYGAGLTRFLTAHAEQVVELDRPKRAARRHGAKSDPLDATRAAREALGRDQLANPERLASARRCRCGWPPAARRSRRHRRPTPAACLVVAAPDALRNQLRGLTTARLVSNCARLRQRTAWDVETTATVASLRALARPIQVLNAEIVEHTRAITVLVRAWRPELLTPTGVGPIVAAVILCAWSHPGLCGSDAAFAMLGGAAPIPASSGQRIRVDSTAPGTASSTRPSTWSS
jgi:transposase